MYFTTLQRSKNVWSRKFYLDYIIHDIPNSISRSEYFDVWLNASKYKFNKDMESFSWYGILIKIHTLAITLKIQNFVKIAFKEWMMQEKPMRNVVENTYAKRRDWLVEHKKHYFEQEIYIVYLFRKFPKDFLQHVLHVSDEDLISFEKVLAS